MGTWSHESFGNDDAADWAADLEEAGDLDFVESTLDAVLDVGKEYLEAPEAARAIAAAEAIARLQGRFGTRDAHSEGVDNWVSRGGVKPSPALAAKAQRALDRILTEPSELLELWEDVEEEVDNWKAAVQDLKARLKA
jgi:hypothetical protein